MKRWTGILAALLVACPSAPTTNACTPGASLPCACADGSSGAQLCGADGTLGACSCSARDAAVVDGAGSDGGAGDGGAGDGGMGDGSACANPDADGDGARSSACGGGDCDDADPDRFPGHPEVCDAADHDEDCDASTFGFRDGDSDTYADARCCNVGASGTRTCGTDCDDAQPGAHPDLPEVCNGRDDDCDSATDEGVLVVSCRDCDGDGHGVPLTATGMACGREPTSTGCAPPMGYATTCDDCDDAATGIYGMHPELCDAIDNDCDTIVDEAVMPVTWYADCDLDGRPALGAATQVSCSMPSTPPTCVAPPGSCAASMTAGWTSIAPAGTSIDCDDFHGSVHPGGTETCDGLDDDCDGHLGATEDADGDGYGRSACGPCGSDCNDGNAAIHPGATDVIGSGIDEDCDGLERCYVDADGDLYGGATTITTTDFGCGASGHATRPGDCCDTERLARPGQTTYFGVARFGCGGFDFDCDGVDTPAYTGCDSCDIGAGCVETRPPGGFSCLRPLPTCGMSTLYMQGCMGDSTVCGPAMQEFRTQICR